MVASYIMGIAQDITLIGALASTTLNLQQWFQIPISVATLTKKHLSTTWNQLYPRWYVSFTWK